MQQQIRHECMDLEKKTLLSAKCSELLFLPHKQNWTEGGDKMSVSITEAGSSSDPLLPKAQFWAEFPTHQLSASTSPPDSPCHLAP